MCGICGSLALDGRDLDPAPVEAMLSAMVHRGPDSGGTFRGRGVVAGIRRLAVIDVAGGDQPLANEDGSVEVVFNGEIYNYRELRSELERRGHRLRTASDTEVLVHLWEESGPEMLQRLDGMFALCIHDRRNGETLLARDRLGIKPLFWSRAGDRIVFASELAVLLEHEGVRADVDPEALTELFFLQYVTGEGTVYRGVRKLLPGHALRVRDGKESVFRWWEPPGDEPAVPADAPRRAEELRELLAASVRQRLIADVPLGLFLSGGLDSSILLHLATELSGRPVSTFSVGFDDEKAHDERRYARLAAESRGADHHELVVSPLGIAEHLPRVIAHLREPVTDPAILPTYLLSRFARERVTVVLAGEGADELFGGYRRYLYQQRVSAAHAVSRWGASTLGRALPRRVVQALDAVGERDPALRHVQWASIVGRTGAGELFDADAYAQFERRSRAAFAPYFPSGRARLRDQLRADRHEWLPHNLLAKVDRASMAFSLEARVPYLDHRLVEWAARLPDELLIRGGSGKWILREAFRDVLPSEILGRPKQGFDLPLAAWIRGPLRPLVQDLLVPERLRDWPGLRPAAVRRMLDVHLSGRQDFGLPLFNLLSAVLFLDGARSAR